MKWLTPVRMLGAGGLTAARGAGALGLVIARTLIWLPRMQVRELLRALVHFGYRSILLAFGVAALTGATVVLQAGVYAERFGARQYSGWAGGYAVLWEFGPLLLGLMMAARVVATTLSVGALATVNNLFAVICEAISSYFVLRLPVRVFFTAFADMLWWGDFLGGILKALAFGLAISLISTAVGLKAHGGARGVGRSAAFSVVASSFAIFALDFLLTPPLTALLST